MPTLRRGISAKVDTLDPHKSSAQWENIVIGDMLIGLTTDDAAGKPIPGMATSWEIDPTGTVWTFKLGDYNWSDGVPVTTEYVKFWYEDVFLNKDIVSTIDTLYAPGGKPLEVEIVDGRTFKVKFAQPYVYFLTILAKDSTGEPSLDRPSFIMPKHYLKNFMPKYADKAALDKVVAQKGVKSVEVICPGFPVDCLETLEEIAMEGKQAFLSSGGQDFHYIACLNDRPAWMSALAALSLVPGCRMIWLDTPFTPIR